VVLTTGFGETVNFVEMLLNDPEEISQRLTDLQLDQVIESIQQMPQAIKNQQDQNNPYDEDDQEDLYDNFAQGCFQAG